MEIFFVALLMISVHQLHANTVKCESKANFSYWGYAGNGADRTCFMKTETAINSTGFIISSRDEHIGALQMHLNEEIRFLPEKVSETFPNLLLIWAYKCSLTEVSKNNFENLAKLRSLFLNNNQIEKIPSNAFEDLMSLSILYLRKFSRSNKVELTSLYILAITFTHCLIFLIFSKQTPTRSSSSTLRLFTS